MLMYIKPRKTMGKVTSPERIAQLKFICAARRKPGIYLDIRFGIRARGQCLMCTSTLSKPHVLVWSAGHI